MKLIKTLFALGLILFVTETFGQELPSTFQTMFGEIITNFETIRTGNSVRKGKHTLSLINENKIAIRTEHKKTVKNLTFTRETKGADWIPANQLTIDMVNKYEEYVTEVLQLMLEISEEKSKE